MIVPRRSFRLCPVEQVDLHASGQLESMTAETFAAEERSLYDGSGGSQSSKWGTGPTFEKVGTKLRMGRPQEARYWNYIYVLKIQLLE